MGSQSVTNFSAAKKKRIRELVKDYSPGGPGAAEQASLIGEAAAGSLGKGPSNEFLQALTSPSVETALGLLVTLADELKRDPAGAYEQLGLGADVRKPVESVGAALIKTHLDRFARTQAETDSTFAARDALMKTVIDVVADAFPREKEPAGVDGRRFAEAFRRVPQERLVTTFLQNAAGALIGRVLDATRGRLPPERMDEIKRRVREQFVPEYVERLLRGE